MNSSVMTVRDHAATDHIDAIEEIRLRTWARKNFAPSTERDHDWHPIIQQEMQQMDQEHAQS